ncbi:MAG: hypothetical protein GY849_25205, partial [Deltaproteobacteria bacterium]|nr:hypothetical protein [Deltaproteobacteria bacterium]
MRKLAKCSIFSAIIGIFLWGSAASAFEFLYEEAGTAYYKADDGTLITHEIDAGATGLQLLYADEANRV